MSIVRSLDKCQHKNLMDIGYVVAFEAFCYDAYCCDCEHMVFCQTGKHLVVPWTVDNKVGWQDYTPHIKNIREIKPIENMEVKIYNKLDKSDYIAYLVNKFGTLDIAYGVVEEMIKVIREGSDKSDLKMVLKMIGDKKCS